MFKATDSPISNESSMLSVSLRQRERERERERVRERTKRVFGFQTAVAERD